MAFFSKVATRVGAGGESQRRLVLGGEVDQRVGELGRVAALLAVHALPGGDGLLGRLGIIGDRGFGVLRRLRCQHFGAEESGLDKHCADRWAATTDGFEPAASTDTS